MSGKMKGYFSGEKLWKYNVWCEKAILFTQVFEEPEKMDSLSILPPLFLPFPFESEAIDSTKHKRKERKRKKD